MERKKISILIFVFFIGLICSLNIKEVKATALRLEHPTNIYYSRYGNGGPYVSNPYTEYYLDNHIGYCIEPGKEIYSYEYKGELGMTSSPFNDSVNKLIQLIGYYGYEYPGHNTIRYKMATQALIWEKVGGQIVRFYTERYDEGEEIIVTKEKNEIMRLVNSHTEKPSFADSNLTGYVGKTIELIDTKNVLSFFEVRDDGGNIVKKEGNKLLITPTTNGKSTITLSKARYDNVSTMLFSPNDSRGQKIAILRFSDEVSMQLNLTAYGSKLKVIKIDEETGEVIKISGIKFKLKDLSNNSYICENQDCTFETSKEGEFITNTYLFGDYELEEVNMDIPGYLWNPEKLKIHIDETSEVGSDNMLEIRFSNRRVKGKLVINKVGEKVVFEDGDYHYEKIPLKNVKYGLYANEDIYCNNILIYRKGTLVKILVTDENGHTEVSDLYLGKYYLMEVETLNDYVIDKTKYEFELTYKNQNTEIVVKEFDLENYLKKGGLEFLKVDSETKKALPETLIEIYKEEDNGPILIYRGYTDVNGQIILNDLPLGKYFLREVESSKGYILSNETFYFDITEDKEVQSITMENDKFVEVEVPSTGLDSSSFLKLAGFACFLVGVLMFAYSKIKKFN